MKRFLGVRFFDKYLLIDRLSGKTAKITKHRFDELKDFVNSGLSRIPVWMPAYLANFMVEIPGIEEVRALFLVRQSRSNQYGKASYEITNKCNLSCLHCYRLQSEEVVPSLTIEQKKNIIELIEQSGCLWLQLTGGEPLFCSDFIELYKYAYDLGLLLVISSNGVRLQDQEILELFKTRPPRRLTISLYGASSDSYSKLTGSATAFEKVVVGLKKIKELGICLRISIIVTKFNESELEQMVELAKQFTSDFHVYRNISPRLNGDTSSLEVASEGNNPELDEECRQDCLAGKTFYNVDALGYAGICKVSRDRTVNLLNESFGSFEKLAKIAEEVMQLPAVCVSCELRVKCQTCRPMQMMYNDISEVPKSVCLENQKFQC
ncbi:radical SAM protein [Candidatus Kuenenbacteria bacterium]|nr:radical SAM protein [Candidatus Kuenenbacteria bacterium]